MFSFSIIPYLHPYAHNLILSDHCGCEMHKSFYPFQPQIVHQDVALVVSVISVVYENVLERMICKDHHPHLQRHEAVVRIKKKGGGG